MTWFTKKMMITSPRTFILLLMGALIGACAPTNAPEPPVYSTPIVVEETARRTANAEIADIDGDGNNDVVLAIGRHWPGPNLLFRGDGAGGFLGVDSLSNPQDRSYSITAVDMDQDGDVDLVVSNDRPDPNYVMLNDGSGAFGERYEFGDPMWPTRNSTVADINNDGRPDVLVANRDSSPEGNNVVCLNETDGDFALACNPIKSGPATTISVADINKDGFLDLVIPYRDLGQSHVYLGNGSGQFEERVPFGPGDASFRAALAIDLNQDDLLDVVAIDDRKNETVAYLQGAGFVFEEEMPVDYGTSRPYALDKADLDQDGREDLLVGYREAPSLIFFNTADSLYSIAFSDSTGDVYGFGIGDVNRDGVLDIVLARSDASDVLFPGSLK